MIIAGKGVLRADAHNTSAISALTSIQKNIARKKCRKSFSSDWLRLAPVLRNKVDFCEIFLSENVAEIIPCVAELVKIG